MRGGEKVNVGFIQALHGSMPESNVRGENLQARDVAGKTAFGSVLSNITSGQQNTVDNLGTNESEALMDNAILSIFSATTVEELIAGLEPGEVSFSDLIAKITPLLEQAGLSESEILAASTATDLWSLLTIVDEIGPKLFAEIASALEGKGAIPKEQAIELLTVLKTVAIMTPEKDLTMIQEQQLFSLQGFLASAGDRFESTLHTNQSRNNVVNLMEASQVIRFVVPNETNEQNLKDTPKEMVHQPITNAFAAMRTEVAPAELESRNNARNETLLREMQAIFKRSNFGHTGGTNRLLIKLYPEHLGQVRIELMQTNGVMTARILASSALGKEMLDSQLHQLRSAFLQQNLQVERIDISQALDDTPKNERQHGMFSQHFKHEQEDAKEQDEQNKEEEITFQEYMIELEA